MKDFISYEEALALKELGFDEPCFKYYVETTEGTFILSYTKLNSDDVTAPLYQQAFRWFREKYNLPSNLELFHIGWDYVIYLDVTEEVDFNEGPWSTYEEAELACLRKLIELVKQKP